MSEAQLIEAFRALQATVWRSVVTSVTAATLTSAVVCLSFGYAQCLETRQELRVLRDRIDAIPAVPAPITLQQVGMPRNEHDNVLEYLKLHASSQASP